MHVEPLIAQLGGVAAPGIIPDARLAALLRAALDPVQASVQWEQYVQLSQHTFPNVGEFRVMPRIARLLAGKGETVSNRAWLDHAVALSQEMETNLQEAQADLKSVLAPFAAKLVATKGTALREMVYDTPGDRPTSDYDYLARWDDLPGIEQALLAAGWSTKLKPRQHTEQSRIAADEWSFASAGGHEVDFSWQPRRSFVYDDSVIDWVLDGSGQNGQIGQLPDPTWLLIESIDHGLSANVVSPIRWALDGALIIARYGPEIDWPRIVSIAKRNKLGTLMFVGLRILADFADVPEDTLADLRRLSGAAIEVDELNARLALKDLVENYRARVRYNSAIRAPRALYRYRRYSPYRAVRGVSARARFALARRNVSSRLLG